MMAGRGGRVVAGRDAEVIDAGWSEHGPSREDGMRSKVRVGWTVASAARLNPDSRRLIFNWQKFQ
jgi:hypothetical protein